jgi:hypothetical protein
VPIPKDDPRRLLHAGDEEKAYPEHFKLRQHQDEVDAILRLAHHLYHHNFKVCEWLEANSDQALMGEFDEYVPVHGLQDPHGRTWQQLAYEEGAGIDWAAFWKEKDTMFKLLAGELEE